MKLISKRSVACAMALTTVLAISSVLPASAAYQLSDEVTNVPQALQEATTIGLRVHETPSLQQLPNKDAIVVSSFGTTFKDTRAKTIDATVQAIQSAHPDVKVVTAFSSHIIRERIQKNEGITYPTPEEALEQLQKDGYTRIAMTTLNIIPGIEYNYNVAVYNQYKDQFKKMTLATPMMYWMGQEDQRDDVMQTVEAVATQFPAAAPDHAVLIMAHGTPDPSNAYYAVIQDRIKALDLPNTYIYTVEGRPHLEDVIPTLREKGIKHVTLMPFMMVAGDHATNDMAGDESDSHKSILESEGFQVHPYLHGLGENPAVRQLFVDRAEEAWQALQQ